MFKQTQRQALLLTQTLPPTNGDTLGPQVLSSQTLGFSCAEWRGGCWSHPGTKGYRRALFLSRDHTNVAIQSSTSELLRDISGHKNSQVTQLSSQSNKLQLPKSQH